MAKYPTLAQTQTIANGVLAKVKAKGYAVKSDLGALAEKSKVALTDLDTDAAAKITALETLIGSDTNKSVRTIANDELAKQLIPENAQDSLDTLQEISAWIQNHPDEVAAINRKLTIGTHEVEGEQVQYDNVKAYVEAYVGSQLTAAALTNGNGINIADGVVSAKVKAENGLSVDGTNGIQLAAATQTAAGAMSATDKAKLDGIELATDDDITALINALNGLEDEN